MADSRLELVVEVDTRRANAAIKSVNTGLNSLESAAVTATRNASRGVDGMTASMTKAVVAGSALFEIAKRAVSSLRAFSLGALELQDELGKSAQKAGLSVQAYTELRHVADLSGLSAESLAVAVGMLSRNMLRAVTSVGEQRRAFSALGVEFRDQTGALRDVNDVLADLADRFAEMPDSATKVALAMELFGRSGREVIPLLNSGGASIRQMREEARQLGIVIDEQTFRAAERFNDNLRRLRQAVRGVGFALLEDLTPRLVELTDRMVAWLRGGGVQQIAIRLREAAEAAKLLGIALISYGLVSQIQKLSSAVGSLNLALAANPWGLAAAGVAALGVVLAREREKLLDYAGALEEAADRAAVLEKIRTGVSLEELRGSGITDEQIRRAVAGRSFSSEQITVEAPVRVRPALDFEALEREEEARKRAAEAERRASELLRRAQEEQLPVLARLIEEYRDLRAELGLTAQAQKDLAAAMEIRIRSAATEELRRQASEAVREIEDTEEARRRQQAESFRQELEFRNETLEREREAASLRLDYEVTVAEQIRDARLRALEAAASSDVDSQLRAAQERARIEEAYLQRRLDLRIEQLRRETELEIQTMETIARARGVTDEAIAARRAAMLAELGERTRELEQQAQADISAVRETAAIRQAEIIRNHHERVFDSLKRQAEGVFDALLTRSQSVWSAIANALKTAILTAIKEILSSQVAALLMRLFSGIRVPVASAGGLASLAGLATPAFGLGVPIPGAPGGTAGITGPVSLGGIGLRSLSAAGLAPLGLGAAMFGLTGAFRLGQRGGVAAGLGIGLGAASGLLGFGALTTLFPALVAAGPLGFIAAAGVGAFAGILGLFRKSAEEKAREKIRATYGVDVRDKGILRQIVEIARQGFGGNLDAAVRSPQVREIVELYALSTGQSIAGLPRKPTPITLTQRGGSLVIADTTEKQAASAPAALGQPVRASSGMGSVLGMSRPDGLFGRLIDAVASEAREVVAHAENGARLVQASGALAQQDLISTARQAMAAISRRAELLGDQSERLSEAMAARASALAERVADQGQIISARAIAQIQTRADLLSDHAQLLSDDIAARAELVSGGLAAGANIRRLIEILEGPISELLRRGDQQKAQTAPAPNTTVVNVQMDSSVIGRVVLRGGRLVSTALQEGLKASAGRREISALQTTPGLVVT